MNTDLRAIVQRNLARRSLDLYFHELRLDGKVSIPERMMWHLYENEDAIEQPIEPILSMPEHTAQNLMDELWNCGIRPTQEGGVGALGATQKHLEDMQKIVFGLLKGQGVQ